MVEDSWALDMEAVCSSDTMISTRGHIPEDNNFYRVEVVSSTATQQFQDSHSGRWHMTRAKTSQFIIELFWVLKTRDVVSCSVDCEQEQAGLWPVAGQVLPAFIAELFRILVQGQVLRLHTHPWTRSNGITPAAVRPCACLFIVMDGFYVQNLGSVKSLDEMGWTELLIYF